MTRNGISYVLNASNSCPKPDFICESRFMRIPVNDSYCEKLLPWLDKSIEFIGEGMEESKDPGLGAAGEGRALNSVGLARMSRGARETEGSGPGLGSTSIP